MKTGTPGHGSRIHAGILPGRKKEPRIRSPAIPVRLFSGRNFSIQAKRPGGRTRREARKRRTEETKKNIHSTCRAKTEEKTKRNIAAGRSRKAKRKHSPDRARQRRGDFYGEKKQGRKENIKI